MQPSTIRVAFRHLTSRGPALMGISTRSYRQRVHSWWEDLERLVKQYWSFQRFEVRRVRGKMTWQVQGASGQLNCEVRGPVNKPTVYVGGAEKSFGPETTLDEIIFWIDGVDRTRAPRQAKRVNRDDPGALLGLLTKVVRRDKPEALEAAKNLSRAVNRMWHRKEKPKEKPRQHPRLNKEKAGSILTYLRWLLVEVNGLDDLDLDLNRFESILNAA